MRRSQAQEESVRKAARVSGERRREAKRRRDEAQQRADTRTQGQMVEDAEADRQAARDGYNPSR